MVPSWFPNIVKKVALGQEKGQQFYIFYVWETTGLCLFLVVFVTRPLFFPLVTKRRYKWHFWSGDSIMMII